MTYIYFIRLSRHTHCIYISKRPRNAMLCSDFSLFCTPPTVAACLLSRKTTIDSDSSHIELENVRAKSDLAVA
jgi:hypothetical protein